MDIVAATTINLIRWFHSPTFSIISPMQRPSAIYSRGAVRTISNSEASARLREANIGGSRMIGDAELHVALLSEIWMVVLLLQALADESEAPETATVSEITAAPETSPWAVRTNPADIPSDRISKAGADRKRASKYRSYKNAGREPVPCAQQDFSYAAEKFPRFFGSAFA